jgi:hypothetical protein
MTPGRVSGLLVELLLGHLPQEEPRMKTTVVRYQAKPERAAENQLSCTGFDGDHQATEV